MPGLIMDIALSGERLQAIYGGRANRVRCAAATVAG